MTNDEDKECECEGTRELTSDSCCKDCGLPVIFRVGDNGDPKNFQIPPSVLVALSQPNEPTRPLGPPWQFVHLGGMAAIACRAHEADGQQRRVTNFIHIETSLGIDADAAAARIASLLNRFPHEAPDTPVGSGSEVVDVRQISSHAKRAAER